MHMDILVECVDMDWPGATSAVVVTVTKQSRLSLDLVGCSVKFSNITLLLKAFVLFLLLSLTC